MSHRNLVDAVKAVHSLRPCVFHNDIEYACALASTVIRTHLSKIRDLAKSERLRQIIFSKATDIVVGHR